nr:type III pantothenate kinase [Wenzhouxiangella sp. XN79A]
MGHSRVKWAELRPGGTLGHAHTTTAEAFPDRVAAEAVASIVLAAVPPDATVRPLVDAVAATGATLVRIALGAPRLDVAPGYATLGVDRWLAFNAAWRQRPDPLCVIDVGTATTVDLVDAEGRHRGGWILPGPEAARSGLLERASGLERPRQPVERFDAPALTTALALERGLVLQQVGALDRAIEAGTRDLGTRPRVVLTGGGAAAVQSALEIDELQPDLVLHGLALAVTRMDPER